MINQQDKQRNILDIAKLKDAFMDDLNIIKQCIKIGYSSVMVDGSHLSFEENIKLTKKVVQMAHKKGIYVEAELGTIGGVEDNVSAKKIILIYQCSGPISCPHSYSGKKVMARTKGSAATIRKGII